MTQASRETDGPANDYAPPHLIEIGTVVDLTQSGGYSWISGGPLAVTSSISP